MALPLFGASIGGIILMIVGSVVGRVLVSLGLSVVTYIGVSYALDFLRDLILQGLSQLPVTVVQLLALMQVGKAMSILFSALFTNMVLNGLTGGGVFKKFALN